MTRNILAIILTTFILALCSCATMINSKKTSLTLTTNEPSNLVINEDTIKTPSVSNSFTLDRDKKPILVTAYNDSITKTVIIPSKDSFAYWLNFYPNVHLWTGFYIDTKTKKRYTYPKTVYSDLTKNDILYLTYKPTNKHFDNYNSPKTVHFDLSTNDHLNTKPDDKPLENYRNIVKITPLKIVGLFSPSIELSYERRTSRRFSTQLMASYLLPNSPIAREREFNPDIKGFNVAVEERYYLKKSKAFGPYVSFELNYLKNQYKGIWNFGVKDMRTDTTSLFVNYPDTFGIKKQTYSFNFKLGYQLMVKRIAIDFYAGLGFRYKDVKHFDRINPNHVMEDPRHPSAFYITNLEGKYWTVSIPLNIKIGWVF